MSIPDIFMELPFCWVLLVMIEALTEQTAALSDSGFAIIWKPRTTFCSRTPSLTVPVLTKSENTALCPQKSSSARREKSFKEAGGMTWVSTGSVCQIAYPTAIPAARASTVEAMAIFRFM
jgi:hypothetical protein